MLNDRDIKTSFSDEIDNQRGSPVEKTEALYSSSTAKEAELVGRIAEEEAKILAEVEILARQEAEYLISQLEREHYPEPPSNTTVEAGFSGPAHTQPPNILEPELEPVVPSQADRSLLDENQLAAVADAEAPGQLKDAIIQEDTMITPEAPSEEAVEEFVPGEYVLQLSQFVTGGAIAFQNALRKFPEIKILATSGAASGIKLHIRLVETLPLVEQLSTMPGVAKVTRQGEQILITGQAA
ncbi:hypothetical protein [Dehalogenimonas etheniformans]|uniref:Uncharacterized protein n=1 Tax=Dehalogenimonas etheniformans TaxID=1536648 RepID=A0A2P5P8I9_9CHLR|nr:hypothetical protein [Dehalogenimonas etheniformans]PPD58607.1 hypothetical protein JP09_001630 [Dehalogenimonas etheniformans]QNT76626.1 hypothetical protein HX448_07990 [Dehalogenimonas etheniformans]